MPNRIKVALASYGMSGQVFHAPFLFSNDRFELSVVLERSKKLCQQRYSLVQSVDTWEALLASDVDLVIVNTPTYLHYTMAKSALLAGKNVVVEKPACTTSIEMQELMEIASRRKLLLNVYHNRRLDSEVLTAKKWINEGKLGKIERFEAYFDRNRPEIGPKAWKEQINPGAGLVYDLGAHLIDQVLYLFGEPNQIKGEIKVERPNGMVPDGFEITFEYSRFQAKIGASMMVTSPRPKLQIEGDTASFVCETFDPQERQLLSGMLPNDPNCGVDRAHHFGTVSASGGPPERISLEKGRYMNYYNNIADLLERKTDDPLVRNAEALRVIEVIEQVYAQNGYNVDGSLKTLAD